MPRNALIRAGGIWNTGTEVEDFEFEFLDLAQHNALSETGGSWAPGEVILLTGVHGLWSQRLRGGADIGAGVAAFEVDGSTISARVPATFTAALNATASSVALSGAGFPSRSTAPSTGHAIKLGAAIRSNTTFELVAGANAGEISFSGTPASGQFIDIELIPNFNASYTFFSVVFRGAAGHAGMPANMPSASIIEYNGSGVATTLATGSLSAGIGTTAYQAAGGTTLLITPTPFTPFGALRYILRITNESGANALSGLTFMFLRGNGTLTRFGATGEN